MRTTTNKPPYFTLLPALLLTDLFLTSILLQEFAHDLGGRFAIGIASWSLGLAGLFIIVLVGVLSPQRLSTPSGWKWIFAILLGIQFVIMSLGFFLFL